MAGFWRRLTSDSQLRWIGPEKGVIHLATAAVVNAVWDLWAKAEKQAAVEAARRHDARGARRAASTSATSPTRSRRTKRWRCCASATAGRARARSRDRAHRLSRLHDVGRLARLRAKPTSVRRCREAIADGWTHFKMKVGADRDDDRRRAALVRAEIGPDRTLMMDANGRWGVDEAIDVDARSGATSSRGGSKSRRARTTCWATRRSRKRDCADRRRDRRAVPEPRPVQAVPAGAAPWTSARSTAAGWAA